MKSRQKNIGNNFKRSILNSLIAFVVIFNSLLAYAFITPAQEVSARSYSGQINATNPPIDTTQEFGIWVDRARIILYNATDPQADVMVDALYTATPLDEGINPGDTVTYKNDAGEGCRSLLVNASQTSGTLTKCGGDVKTVTLMNRQNAEIDGFYYVGGEQIEMPRFVGGIDNCGDGGNVTAKYMRGGIFNKDGDEYRETVKSSPDQDEKTYISDSDIGGDRDSGGDRVLTAKQRRKSTDVAAGVTLQNCTIGYANDRNNDPRSINLLNGYTEREVTSAAQAKADEFNEARGRLRLLTAYFTANPESVPILQDCASATGQATGLASMVKYLAENYTPANPAIGDPFIDCALRELGDDADFAAALEYNFEGAYDDSIVSESESDCGDGGIPIVSDIACWLVGWVFDALHAGFKSVIDYLATPPDMFEEQNSTLAQSMKNLRNIANLIFVVAFLLVVFQYMTNINVVDAYFVKKFIPRLVIAVILVQASFFIVSELNYFFYDLGKSIQTIVFQGNDVGDLVVNNGAATLALTAGVALGPALIGLLLVIGVILLLVLLITMIVLAVRYILIIVLAILAPIAFAALAIPQLEGMTKKWFNMYIKLLLMYPMIMFFLAASAVVAGALSGGGIILQIISLVAAFLPFIILPFTFKFAGGLMGNVTAKIMKAPGKGYKAYKKGEGLYESKTASGRARAAERKLKDGIKADRASNAGSDRLSRKVRGMGSFRKQRLFGGEEEKYMGIVKDREDKRKADEAKSLLDTQLKGMPDRTAAVSHLNDTYHRAMASGDVHTANAAYAGLVGQQAEAELSRIQEEAHDTTNDAVNHEIYNRQQGSNYGDLKAFAPHLTGDVGHGGDLSAQRAKNLSALSNEQLASVKPEAHEAFGRVDGAAAISRIQGIIAAGGGPAGKLSPDAVSKALAGAAQSSSTGNFHNAVTAAGGLGSVATDDLRKAYESVTSKLSSTDHGLNASELANARSAVASMASELGRR